MFSSLRYWRHTHKRGADWNTQYVNDETDQHTHTQTRIIFLSIDLHSVEIFFYAIVCVLGIFFALLWMRHEHFEWSEWRCVSAFYCSSLESAKHNFRLFFLRWSVIDDEIDEREGTRTRIALSVYTDTTPHIWGVRWEHYTASQHIADRVHVNVSDIFFHTQSHTRFLCRKERIKNGTRVDNFCKYRKRILIEKKTPRKQHPTMKPTHTSTHERAHVPTHTERERQDEERVRERRLCVWYRTIEKTARTIYARNIFSRVLASIVLPRRKSVIWN